VTRLRSHRWEPPQAALAREMERERELAAELAAESAALDELAPTLRARGATVADLLTWSSLSGRDYHPVLTSEDDARRYDEHASYGLSTTCPRCGDPGDATVPATAPGGALGPCRACGLEPCAFPAR